MLFESDDFDNKCIRKWCNSCIDKNYEPNCPLCRTTISNEYLDILDIDYSSKNNLLKKHKIIQLYLYIVNNKIYEDIDKLEELNQQNLEEFMSVIQMIKRYFMSNMSRT